jgi:hypothetical protein
MSLDLFLIILGLVFLIIVMATFLNPPEALVKRLFRRSTGRTRSNDRDDA